MDIKMALKPLGSYKVSIRGRESLRDEACQKLTITRVAPGNDSQGAEDRPTHQIVYYSFGCKRILQGRLTENQEDRVVFQADDREFEFSTQGPAK